MRIELPTVKALFKMAAMHALIVHGKLDATEIATKAEEIAEACTNEPGTCHNNTQTIRVIE